MTSMTKEVLATSQLTAKNNSIFEIQCPDRYLRTATVTDEYGAVIYTLEGPGLLSSWSLRRSLKDASGNHILDMRHYKSRLGQWIVEDPQGSQQCITKDVTSLSKNVTNATVQITDSSKNYAGANTMSIRSNDHAGTRTFFQIGERKSDCDDVSEDGIVAELTVKENNDMSFLHSRNMMRTSWQLTVKQGTDVALALALAFIRIEISHTWRR